MRILRKSIVDLVAYVLSAIFALVGSIVSLHRFWQYEVSLIDFGLFDQAIWKVAHFQAPIVYHFIYGRINTMGDHLTPSIFLLSPLYWITDRSEVLLIAQAVIVAMSGAVLYDLAKTVLKDTVAALCIMVVYFLFVGLQNAVITEFHELTVMTLPLMLTIWAFVKKKVLLFYLFLIITLGCKEVMAITAVMIGVAFYFLDRSWRKHALMAIVISAVWGILSFTVIMPHFSGGAYLYASNIPDGVLPKITALFDAPQKRTTLLYSFLHFGFLPLFSPPFYLAILQDYATRFLPENFVTRWDLGMHYNAQSAVLLSVSSVFGMRQLFRWKKIMKFQTVFCVTLVVVSFLLFRVVLHGPFLLAINTDFYRHSNNFGFLDKMIAVVPKTASVMTHNNLATRFTHQSIRLITPEYHRVNPDYILLDMRKEQSPNNYFGSGDIQGTFEKLKQDPQYRIVYQSSDQYVFKKK